jgi:putative transposase
MGIGRSTFYDTPDARASDAIIVAEMKTICDQFEAYGYRRVDAELRHRGIVVNAKKIRRLMREHALNPKQRRRFIATTDSDHNYPIFPDLAKNMMPDSPNQLWVADITYVAIATGFVYLAAILDAWSRRVVGYAISRSIDARLVVAALKAAISARNPPRGCVHHSDRGSQYASSEIEQDRVAVEHDRITVDDGGHLGVRIDRQILRLMLLAFTRVDRNRLVGKSGFLEEERHLGRVGRAAVIELQHDDIPRVGGS